MSSISYLVIPVIAWFVAHLIKFTYKAVKENNIDYFSFMSSGGLVSAHASVVTALAVTVGVLEGVRTASFGIAITFAFLVMYDALATRRVVGEITAHLRGMHDNQDKYGLLVSTRYKGHSPQEVFYGFLLGGSIAALLTLRHWTERAVVFFESYPSPSGNLESQLYLAGALIAIVFGLSINRYLKKHVPHRYPRYVMIRRWVFANTTFTGLIGLLLLWFAHENVTVLTWRFWLYVIAGVSALSSARLAFMYHSQYSAEIQNSIADEKRRKQKKTKKKKSRKKRR